MNAVLDFGLLRCPSGSSLRLVRSHANKLHFVLYSAVFVCQTGCLGIRKTKTWSASSFAIQGRAGNTKLLETIRVPGLHSAISFCSSRSIFHGRRYTQTISAFRRSVLQKLLRINRAVPWCRMNNETIREYQTRNGLISTPSAWAPLAAASRTRRPSPDPRSMMFSPALHPERAIIHSEVFCVEGTNGAPVTNATHR